jgi:hypothetical protein
VVSHLLTSIPGQGAAQLLRQFAHVLCRARLEKTIEAGGWTKELLLRHETAHCNGWPGDHPGKRMCIPCLLIG